MPNSRRIKNLAFFSLLALTMVGCARRSAPFLEKSNAAINRLLPLPERPILPAPPISPFDLLSGLFAHNDYEHKNLLYGALGYNCGGLEADVVLEDGEMRVAHTAFSTKKGRTLESLYLKPLAKIVQENNGRVNPDSKKSLLFLIDVKSGSMETYLALHEIFKKYKSMLTTCTNGVTEEKAITILISGHEPSPEFMKDQPERYAFLDGRLWQLNKFSASLMPMISARWNEKCDENLSKIVKEAHNNGQLIRFWATREDKFMWKKLRNAGVDLINTDKLSKVHDFLLEENNPALPVAQIANKKTAYTVAALK
jgi:glycerophosphoryl diester phosphodiesterase